MPTHALLCSFIVLTLSFSACTTATSEKGNTDNTHTSSPMITKEKALEIAQSNAKNVYRDLSIYEVIAVQEEGNWKIDYELLDENSLGGGPHYLISGETGEIISSRYEQ